MRNKFDVSYLRQLSTWAVIVTAVVLLVMGSVTTALAQADGDGDGFDGDELGVPIVLGVAALAYVGWLAYRRRSSTRRG